MGRTFEQTLKAWQFTITPVCIGQNFTEGGDDYRLLIQGPDDAMLTEARFTIYPGPADGTALMQQFFQSLHLLDSAEGPAFDTWASAHDRPRDSITALREYERIMRDRAAFLRTFSLFAILEELRQADLESIGLGWMA